MNSARKCITAVLIVIFGISMLSGCSSPITKPFYTKESLMEQCGFDKVYEHETYFADEKCLMLMKSNLINGKEYYDYMVFYLFDTVEDAEKAFNETEDWFFKDVDFRSDIDYRCGWLKEAYDADVYDYIHISGNLIITAYLEYNSNYYEEGDDYMPSTTSKKIDRDDFIDFVEKEFPYSQSA